MKNKITNYKIQDKMKYLFDTNEKIAQNHS